MTSEDLLCKKIINDYEVFKANTLQCSTEDVFSNAYKIHFMNEIKEVVCINAERIVDSLSGLKLTMYMNLPSLLEVLYSEWLKREDSFFEELTDTMMHIIVE